MVWIVLGGVILLLLVVIGVILWRQRRDIAVPPVMVSPELEATSFGAAMTILYQDKTARDRYDFPCVLVCGESGSGKSNLLRSASLEPVFSSTYSGWWRNMDGAVFELPDAALRNVGISGPWTECLALLKKHRGQRPLDALVWVLPLSALNASGDIGDKLLAEMGARMREKFFDIQNRLGLRLPVYIVVSKCDTVAGFSAFASKLPVALQEQSLGWSNPHSPGTAFQKIWVEQGLSGMTRKLRSFISELGSQADVGGNFDDVFLLPDRMVQALAKLPNLLQQVLYPNATMQAFDLRSIHFSGLTEDARKSITPELDPFGPGLAIAVTEIEPIPVFGRELFAKRIFSEFGLALLVQRKLTGERSWRDRAVWGSFGIAAIFLVCMLISYPYALKQAHSMLMPLSKIKIANNQAENFRSQGNTVELLKNMDDVSDWTMKFAFLPLSWGSDLDQKIHVALKKYYEENLFKSFELALITRANMLLQTNLSIGMTENTIKATAPEFMPEFINVSLFADQTLLYESARNKFLNMTKDGEGSWTDAANLMQYLFDLTSPPRSKESIQLFDSIIQQSIYNPSQILVQHIQGQFEQHFITLYEAWLGRLFVQTGLTESIDNLKTSLQKLVAGNLNENAALNGLQHAIMDLRALLMQTNLSGTADGSAYSGLLKKIEKSSLLGAAAGSNALQKRVVQAQNRFRSQISEAASGEDAVLDNVQGKNLVINADILALEQSLSKLLQHSFAQGDSSTDSAQAGIANTGALINWDLAQLETALGSYQEYLAYEATELPKAPLRFQAILQKIARTQASVFLNNSLKQAAMTASANNEWRSSNFAQAQKQIRPLISGLRKLDQARFSMQWQTLLDHQALLLLKNLNIEFNNSKLYYPDEVAVAAWDGKRLAAQRAFGAATPSDLDEYLATQFAIVTALVEASKVPRAWLEQGQADTPSSQWLALDTALAKYATKNPSGTIKQLEQLIVKDLNEIDSISCGDKLLAPNHVQESDYFQKRSLSLRALFSQRCISLQASNSRSAYAAIADYYNTTLLSRYPFTNKQDAPPADPENVRELMRLLVTDLGLAREGLMRQPEGSNGAALSFLDKMSGIKPLMTALLSLDPVTGAPVAIDLWPEYRINRGRDKGAEQIIDWNIEAGALAQNTQTKANPLSWRLGDSMAVSLRWAKNSAFSPVADPNHFPGVQIDAKKAGWQYSGPWALLHLLNEHAVAATELNVKETLQPQVLRFAVATGDNSGLPLGDALAFARLGVSVHGKSERLALPVFPSSSAPPFPRVEP